MPAAGHPPPAARARGRPPRWRASPSAPAPSAWATCGALWDSTLATEDAVVVRQLRVPRTALGLLGLTVGDLVARGRHPHQSWLRQWSPDDETVVAEALAWTDVADLAERPLDALSGGQRQRAWISMALALGTDLLLLDEPTTYP